MVHWRSVHFVVFLSLIGLIYLNSSSETTNWRALHPSHSLASHLSVRIHITLSMHSSIGSSCLDWPCLFEVTSGLSDGVYRSLRSGILLRDRFCIRSKCNLFSQDRADSILGVSVRNLEDHLYSDPANATSHWIIAWVEPIQRYNKKSNKDIQ